MHSGGARSEVQTDSHSESKVTSLATFVSERPARVLMTVSPPGYEHYFEELARLAAQGAPDPKALADLRDRYDTDQLSTLTTRA
jgi:hypothetical protein